MFLLTSNKSVTVLYSKYPCLDWCSCACLCVTVSPSLNRYQLLIPVTHVHSCQGNALRCTVTKRARYSTFLVLSKSSTEALGYTSRPMPNYFASLNSLAYVIQCVLRVAECNCASHPVSSKGKEKLILFGEKT